MNKNDLRNIIALAMLHDPRRRFDAWTGAEAQEWIEPIVEQIDRERQSNDGRKVADELDTTQQS